MREQDNYFADVEQAAAGLLGATGYATGPITRTAVDQMADHLGFSLVHTSDLPESTRTVTDLAHRRIYLPQPTAGQSDSRSLALQALGHIVLEHRVPQDYGEFLEQRVEVNYFAAALLIPEKPALTLLSKAKARKDIAIEDLRDAYAVSYEMAAHRFTNLATRHLGLPVHFMRISLVGHHLQGLRERRRPLPHRHDRRDRGQAGLPLLDRARGLRPARPVHGLPAVHRHRLRAPTGARRWSTRRRPGPSRCRVGVPYQHVKWMRGRDTTHRSVSRCPDPTCCSLPPADLASRWDRLAWPSARVHSHLLAAMPPGVFPGVDDTDVLRFLQQHAPVGS